MSGKLNFKIVQQNERLMDLVNGYIRTIFNIYAPNIIVCNIALFYTINNIIPCNIFDSKWKNRTKPLKNVVNIIPNKDRQFYVTNDNLLYIYPENESRYFGKRSSIKKNVIDQHKFFTNKKCVNIMSHGQYNDHSFVYTLDNELYGFGKNNYGQIGIHSPMNIAFPVLISYNFDSSIIQIDCGYYHSMFLTLNGSVYGCGTNKYGQLTSGYPIDFTDDKYSIIKLEMFSNVKCIACTTHASMLCDINGVLYTFGNNDFKELGTTKYNKYDINRINDLNIDVITGGSFHLCCLTINKIGYSFGWNEHGQCGTKLNHSGSIAKPTKIDIDSMLYSIKNGRFHTIIKTINNEYYSCGNNTSNECLLNTSDKSIFKPTKISREHIILNTQFNGEIIDIIPGCNNTFILQSL